MDEVNETLWRSIDSNPSELADSLLSCDTSFKSLIGCSDSSEGIISPAIFTPKKKGMKVEDDLLDALRNLQIASSRKLSAARVSSIEQSLNKITKLEYETISNDDLSVAPSIVHEQNMCNETTTETTFSPEKCMQNSHNTLANDPPVIGNMTKAVKPLLKPAITNKKITKAVSPMLQTGQRSRTRNTLSLNHSSQTTNNNNKNKNNVLNMTCEKEPKRSTSLKRQTVKNVVATLVSTKDGMKLQEEKINNFGIPVNIDRKKKRTQPMPFNLTSRNKSEGHAKLSMMDVTSQDNQSLQRNHTQPRKFETLRKPSMSKHDLSTNKENNLTIRNGSKVLTTGSMLSTGRKLKERSEFDEKVKQREKELAAMKARVELKKGQKERMSQLKAPKKIQSKVNPMSAFKIPLPIKSTKPLTEPKGPTFLSKANKL